MMGMQEACNVTRMRTEKLRSLKQRKGKAKQGKLYYINEIKNIDSWSGREYEKYRVIKFLDIQNRRVTCIFTNLKFCQWGGLKEQCMGRVTIYLFFWRKEKWLIFARQPNGLLRPFAGPSSKNIMLSDFLKQRHVENLNLAVDELDKSSQLTEQKKAGQTTGKSKMMDDDVKVSLHDLARLFLTDKEKGWSKKAVKSSSIINIIIITDRHHHYSSSWSE